MYATPYLCSMVIKNNVSLKPYNTFGVDARAGYFAEVKSVSDLKKAFRFIGEKEISFLILGGGSNVLFKNNFDGMVLLNRMSGIETIDESADFVMLKVAGGEPWPDLVDYCVGQGLGGIENLSNIPGTVGAAPIQNIGAYGVEVKEVVEEVEVFDLQNGQTHTLSNRQCEFAYRSSVFKTSARGRYFVLSVKLKLSKKPVINLSYAPLKKMFESRNIESVSIKEVSAAVKHIRKSKLPDPENMGNAGSFFKNPVVTKAELQNLLKKYGDMPYYPFGGNSFKLAAGWLIEQCGFKGKHMGNAGVHEKQALVIVNHGHASGEEILNLAMEVKHSVAEKFGIELEFEVNVV